MKSKQTYFRIWKIFFKDIIITIKNGLNNYSRFLKESSQAASHQQEKLLAEEDPGDLL